MLPATEPAVGSEVRGSSRAEGAAPQTTASQNVSETVTVPGSAERGVSFVTSTWRVTVVGSAYFPWPDDSGDRQQWRTVLYTNIDRPIKWSDERITGITESANPDAVVGVWDDDTLRSDTASASTFG
ncbi:MAG: hypothetical protein DCC58_16025 [Chloroflexi bacterium]|nr:MAG: hypothetical protein DCC58_16025 [Chloroflexota bacterium]